MCRADPDAREDGVGEDSNAVELDEAGRLADPGEREVGADADRAMWWWQRGGRSDGGRWQERFGAARERVWVRKRWLGEVVPRVAHAATVVVVALLAPARAFACVRTRSKK